MNLQDARYVIDTITSFAVSCPENPAFFRKNRQFFENIPRKILHILNILEKCCILEKSRKNLVTFGENSANSGKICKFLGKKQKKETAIFNENFEIRVCHFSFSQCLFLYISSPRRIPRERCKGVHCVDLGESFPTLFK